MQEIAISGLLLIGLTAIEVTAQQMPAKPRVDKKSEYRTLQKDVDQLQKENQQLSEQIKALKTDPSAIEKEAREQLHYARPGEVVYLTPGQPKPNAPPPNASAKK